ncbi:MAG TPA: prolyl oligopeptidase family serine peptidase [Terriglobales bacterium]|nr:prolyl oligopeptidase family serine peptidase [Terriglobales bacterium]
MKRRILILLSLLVLSGLGVAQTAAPAPGGPPATRRDDVQETLHGVTIADPYRWLEDQNSPETRTWINQQNAYTHSLLDRWPGRDRLEKRLSELWEVERMTSPIERHGRLFYLKCAAYQEQFVIYMREGEHGKEQALIDPNPMSADHSTNVSIMDVAKNGKLLIYGLRLGGKDESELHVMDVDNRRDLGDMLPAHVYFDVSFLPDSSGFYYSMMADEGPRVRLHKMGTKADADVDVFGKGYTKQDIIVGDVSEDGRHLVIQAMHGSAADSVEIWVQNLAKMGSIEPVIKDLKARTFAYAVGDDLFLQTNYQAPKGKVMRLNLAKPAPENWREVVPESENAIDSVTLAGGKIIVSYVKNATNIVKAFEPDGKLAFEASLPALGATFDFQGKWENENLYFGFASFVVPNTLYRWDMKRGKQAVWAQVKVPVDSAKFETQQVWYASKDGTKVPMFLVYAKGTKLDGTNPALLEGYGGFAVNNTPYFDRQAVVWAERGGVFALASLRGGGEFGEAWHKAGMLDKKQNVFDDFIGASEWLIQNKYTNPAKLSILGGSNGGLLVGAALTQRPELYQAVVCWHPLLDMLRYDQFMEAQFWVTEYGTAKDPEQFKWLYAYSPYQHVKQGVKYPAVLFMTGDGDTRVAPLHARKMTALLQADTGSNRPILLRYETAAGHAGGRSLSQEVGDDVDELSFLFWQLDVAP